MARLLAPAKPATTRLGVKAMMQHRLAFPKMLIAATLAAQSLHG
jgi:hypothetical protein